MIPFGSYIKDFGRSRAILYSHRKVEHGWFRLVLRTHEIKKHRRGYDAVCML